MPSTAKVFTKDIMSNPFGGFDPETHIVAVAISEDFYRKTLKPLYAQVMDLRKKKHFGIYCLEFWCGMDAFQAEPDDEGNGYHRGKEVRTECDLCRVMDDGILWTYHEKYYDGVYWETDTIYFEELDAFFKPNPQRRRGGLK